MDAFGVTGVSETKWILDHLDCHSVKKTIHKQCDIGNSDEILRFLCKVESEVDAMDLYEIDLDKSVVEPSS